MNKSKTIGINMKNLKLHGPDYNKPKITKTYIIKQRTS